MNTLGLRSLTIQKRLILLIVLIMVVMMIPLGYIINQYQHDLMSAKQTKTRHLVESAHSLLGHFHQLQRDGKLSEQQAKDAASTAIEKLRYETQDYFWINDMYPKVVMHPIKPALNGKDVSKVKDANGQLLFVEFVNVAKKKGQGIVYYMWPKPGSENPVEKVSYIKLFKPWGWIVGTGVYVDDVDALVWQRIQLVLYTLVVSLIVAVTLAMWISRSISRPCKQTLDALDEIASGDGDLTRHLDEHGKDELAQIAVAFNQFSQKIRSIVQDITPVGEGITSSAVELNEIA